MHARFLWLLGTAALVATAPTALPASAQEANRIVGALNAILNPQDALRLEERARRQGRAEEERYWRDYRAGLDHRAGLEHRSPAREDQYPPHYGEGERRGVAVGPEETRRLDEQARRFEERSHRSHRAAEERYWRDYRAGLEGRARE